MFEPKHLSQDQIRELYRQILTQSEEAELVAHANYIRAQAARVAAERELERLAPRNCEDRGLHANANEKLRHTPASHEG